MIDEAAKAGGMTTSVFVLLHATEAARRVLADRTSFVLPAERWDSFMTLVERPDSPQPELAAFLARPSVFDEG